MTGDESLKMVFSISSLFCFIMVRNYKSKDIKKKQ